MTDRALHLIQSADNPLYRQLRKLCQSSRERRKAGQVVLDGMHLIQAYEAQWGPVAQLWVREGDRERGEIGAFLAAHPERRPLFLADKLMGDLGVVETPSGIMAVIPAPEADQAPGYAEDTVLLDGVQDPGNLGSILRSAAAAGFRQVLLSPDCAQAWAPKTLRAGQGAHFLLRIYEHQALVPFLEDFQGAVAVTSLAARESLYRLELPSPVAWIFGSEGQGVSPAVAACATHLVKIPMPGACESLNVAAAAAICLFETVRRRLDGC